MSRANRWYAALIPYRRKRPTRRLLKTSDGCRTLPHPFLPFPAVLQRKPKEGKKKRRVQTEQSVNGTQRQGRLLRAHQSFPRFHARQKSLGFSAGPATYARAVGWPPFSYARSVPILSQRPARKKKKDGPRENGAAKRRADRWPIFSPFVRLIPF